MLHEDLLQRNNVIMLHQHRLQRNNVIIILCSLKYNFLNINFSNPMKFFLNTPNIYSAIVTLLEVKIS